MVTWLLSGGALLIAWLGLWNKLRLDWSVNDQYQYGWFVPPLALALLALRWVDRPGASRVNRALGCALAVGAASILALLLPIRLIEQPNPDWRLLFWIHAVALVALSLAFCFWTGGWRWAWHFAFPIGFLLLAVPWPSELEQAIVQSLMRVVAIISAEGMNLLGIPAHPQGNLVHIRDQTVGVDEACSGIRSLQTMLMVGLLLGELSRLRRSRRLVLLVGGVLVALIANVFRSSLLVWIAATHGTAALERYHDTAGVSVLLIVFGGLLGFNHLLARGNRLTVASATAAESSDVLVKPRLVPLVAIPRNLPRGLLVVAALWLVFTEAGTAAWYGVLAPRRDPLPGWTVAPPADAPGFQNIKLDERTSHLLRYDHGVAARWNRPGAPASDCNLYFFQWEAGHASAVQADMHQPHICLTASGLTQVADWGIQPLPLPGGISLPVRRYEFSLHGHSIYVFFVVWQDQANSQALASASGSRWDRLRAVLEHRPNLGRQTLEFIVSGPASAGQASDLFEQEVGAMVKPITTGAPLAIR